MWRSVLLGALFLVAQASAQCDCGVTWTSLSDPTLSSFNQPVTIINLPGVTTYMPVRFQNQAQFLCYDTLGCDGILFNPTGTWTYMFSLRTNPGSWTFLGNSIGLSTDVINNHNLYTVMLQDRFANYPCLDDTPDYYFIYFQSGARTEIEQEACPNYLSDGITCCWHPAAPSDVICTNPSPTRATAMAVSSWQTAVTAWWAGGAFLERWSPNVNCTLLPTIYTEQSFCQQPQTGCFRADCGNPASLPCDGNGYCVPTLPGQNYTTPYHCQCQNYTGGQFDNIYQYMGAACEYSTSSGCQYLGDATEMCHGFDSRCEQYYIYTSPTECPLVSKGWNDFQPRCECDQAPAVPGTGDFCEINRCDAANLCQVRGVGAGQCELVGPGPLDFACVCNSGSVGTHCEQSSATCIAPGDSFECHGAGTCIQAGESPSLYPLSQYPNYNASFPWCACTTNVTYGPQCQFVACSNPPVVPPNHGVCDPSTGSFQHCLSPFISSGTFPSGPLCDINLCSQFGNGTASGNPPVTCNCGAYQQANLGSCNPRNTGTPCDVTCYPRCPTYEGGVCGTVGTCVQTQNLAQTARYAQCTCPVTSPPNSPGTQGYIAVNYNATLMDPTHVNNKSSFNPPVGQQIQICEAYCVHGSVDQFWTPSHLTPCLCPNTGFDINIVGGIPQNPRCDHMTCQNGGSWNFTSQSCNCLPTFTASSNCAQSACDNPATSFVEGVGTPDPLNPPYKICDCNPPFTYSTASRTDCNSNLCSPGGVVNTSIVVGTPPSKMCICSGVLSTQCSDPTGETCSFCTDDACAHQGFANPSNYSDCLCIFPYLGGNLCQTSACALNSSITEQSSCDCLFGFSGYTCSTSPCINGAFNFNSHTCNCIPGWTGSTCSTSTSSSSSTVVISSTGHSSSSSVISSSSASTAPSSSSTGSPSSSSSSSSSSSHPSSSSSTASNSSTAAAVAVAASIWTPTIIAATVVAAAVVVTASGVGIAAAVGAGVFATVPSTATAAGAAAAGYVPAVAHSAASSVQLTTAIPGVSGISRPEMVERVYYV